MIGKIRPILTLMLICAVSAFTILNVEKTTKVYIQKQQEETIISGYKEVFPNLGLIKKLNYAGNTVINEVVASVNNGEVNGYIYTVKPSGYSGEITTMLAFDSKSHEITGVKILRQQETPGLGAKCKETSFTERFVGKAAAQPLSVVKNNASNNDIQAITAATITSRAVVSGVNAAREHFESLGQNELVIN